MKNYIVIIPSCGPMGSKDDVKFLTEKEISKLKIIPEYLRIYKIEKELSLKEKKGLIK